MASNRPAFEAESVESSLEFLLKTAGVSELELLPHLDLRSLLRLSQTNRGIHGLFANGHFRKAMLDALMTYLAHIIVNEPTGKNITILILLLTNMLSSYPELLTWKIPKVVFKETGQAYINYSLLQLAFAEYDDELCCDAFEPFFERVFGSKEAARAEIRKQLEEKFPEESKIKKLAREAEERNTLVALLTPAKVAFTQEQFNNGQDADRKWILSDVTHTHITSFREAFDALQPKEIYKGRRFSLSTPQIFYDDLAQTINLWRYGQSAYHRFALYLDALISHMQCYIHQNVAMYSAQGLYYLQKTSEVFTRDATLRSDSATERGKPAEGPRLNFHGCLRQVSLDFSTLVGSSVDIGLGQGIAFRGPLAWMTWPQWCTAYQNACRTKTTSLQSLRGETKSILRPGQ